LTFVLGAYGGLISAVSGLTLMLLTNGIYQKCRKTKKAVPLAPFLCGGFALILILEIYL
jgi:prepilin signal peptidase PulO-like enzyme (type II secretory pathway)